MRFGRMVVAMLIFPATAWLTALVLETLGMAHEPVGALLTGALPTAIVILGPVYLSHVGRVLSDPPVTVRAR